MRKRLVWEKVQEQQLVKIIANNIPKKDRTNKWLLKGDKE